MRASALSILAMAPVLLTILISAPRSVGQANAGWVTVRDNREQAFSVEVPRGWKTFGGMFRASLIDVRPFIDMTSPDGKINVRIGDASIPAFSTPKTGMAGLRARQMGEPAYLTGVQFAVRYGLARFSRMCQGLRVTRSEDKPPRYTSAGQGPMRGTAGEAVLSCTLNGQAMTGYVYAETFIVGFGQPIANWQLISLGSAFAPSDQARTAVDLLMHSGQSLTMNPAWTGMQNRFNAMATQRNLASATATIRETARMNAYEQQMIANMDHEQANMNDIINGVQVQRDPATGREYETPLGTGGPQWIDPASNVAVQSALSPGAGYSRLESVGR